MRRECRCHVELSNVSARTTQKARSVGDARPRDTNTARQSTFLLLTQRGVPYLSRMSGIPGVGAQPPIKVHITDCLMVCRESSCCQ